MTELDKTLEQILGFTTRLNDTDIIYLIQKVDGLYKDRKITGATLTSEILRITGTALWSAKITKAAGTWGYSLGHTDLYLGAIVTYGFVYESKPKIGRAWIISDGSSCYQNLINDYEIPGSETGIEIPYEGMLSAGQLTFRFILPGSTDFRYKTDLILK
jgi:hypothetical protein